MRKGAVTYPGHCHLHWHHLVSQCWLGPLVCHSCHATSLPQLPVCHLLNCPLSFCTGLIPLHAFLPVSLAPLTMQKRAVTYPVSITSTGTWLLPWCWLGLDAPWVLLFPLAMLSHWPCCPTGLVSPANLAAPLVLLAYCAGSSPWLSGLTS